MTRIRNYAAFLLALCSLLVVHERDAAMLMVASAATQQPAEKQKRCKVVEECHRCTYGDKNEIAECTLTGKIMVQSCIVSAGDPSSKQLEYHVCLRTKAEDEFLMVRLQVVCLLVGMLAFWSVRKQRIATSSLFDQRKRRVSSEPITTSLKTTTTSTGRSNHSRMEDDDDDDDDDRGSSRDDHLELTSLSSLSTFASKEETMPLTRLTNMEIV